MTAQKNMNSIHVPSKIMILLFNNTEGSIPS